MVAFNVFSDAFIAILMKLGRTILIMKKMGFIRIKIIANCAR